MRAPDTQPPAPVSGNAIYYDGVTAARQAVRIELAAEALRIHDANGAILAEWPFDALESHSSPDDVLRLGRADNPVPARLEIRDPQLAAAIDERWLPVDRTHRIERRLRGRVIAWSLAATASFLVVAIVGMPRLAGDLAPLIPYSLERKFGATIERQARASLDAQHAGP